MGNAKHNYYGTLQFTYHTGAQALALYTLISTSNSWSHIQTGLT